MLLLNNACVHFWQAKPETVQKVCEIVRRQLALPAETELTSESKFSALGADSLDTVRLTLLLSIWLNLIWQYNRNMMIELLS